jgi:phage terminase large subunit GpA-like protein
MSEQRAGEAFARDFLANPSWAALSLAAEVFEPPPELDLNRWAEEHLIVGSESPYPGPYNSNRFPFFREILEALGPEDANRVICLCGSAQIGKTFIAQIFVAASLDLDPGAILYVHPTETNAVRFARTKWRPQIASCERLRELLDTRQSKEGGNSTLYQERKDGRGRIILSGANSAATLSMISTKRQVQDDLSKWENNLAGDPEAQADSRSKAFADAKILKTSTPLLKGTCRITRIFEAGTQHYYHVPCPHCGHRHVLDPDNLIEHIDAEDPSAAHFTCPQCDGKIEQRHRNAMVRQGQWVASNPQAPHKSYCIWAAYAPVESWGRIARSYLAALGDPASEQSWWNDTGGRAYELPGEAPPWEDIKARAERGGRQLGQVPSGALILTLTLDVQDDYLDGAVYGWGRNLCRWHIARVRIDGHISQPETRAELNRLVRYEWPTAWGTRRPVDLTGIDAGAWTDDVFDWAQGFPKSQVIMVRGVRGDASPALALVRRERRADGKIVKYQGRFYNVGVSSIKGQFYKFLTQEVPGGRGYIDYPAGLDDDFYEQLTAEKRTPIVDKAGFTVYAWIKPRGMRNEQLDVAVYAQAMATKLGWRIMTEEHWNRLRAAREVSGDPEAPVEHAASEFWNKSEEVLPAAAPEPEPPPKPPQPPRPQPPRRVARSGWLRRIM